MSNPKNIKIVVDKNTPPQHDYYGLVFKWERGVDPFHTTAFPPEFRHVGTEGTRSSGWFGLDYWGNRIFFVADGTLLDNELPAWDESERTGSWRGMCVKCGERERYYHVSTKKLFDLCAVCGIDAINAILGEQNGGE